MRNAFADIPDTDIVFNVEFLVLITRSIFSPALLLCATSTFLNNLVLSVYTVFTRE